MTETILEALRRIDDAGLDVYQYRMLMHFFRVGESWERIRTLAQKCKMSVGKASETRQWLLDNDFIEWKANSNGRFTIVVCSRDEQLQQECSPHEQNVHHTNKMFTTRTKCSPGERHLKKALLSKPNEGKPLEENNGADRTPALPGYLATPTMMNAWGDWMQYHEERGKPITISTALKQFEKFREWGEERSKSAIDYSITMNYVGLVEPRASSNGRQETTLDRSKKAVERFMNG